MGSECGTWVIPQTNPEKVILFRIEMKKIKQSEGRGTTLQKDIELRDLNNELAK